ncbi:hypothetical protein AIIKEEIJ_02980 [Rhodococcus sp. YH1]|nr:hypothetical protein [Rhodococcus sp. YH1]
MHHPGTLEGNECLQQVGTPAFEQIDRQPAALGGQLLREGGASRVVHDESRAAADVLLGGQLHDARIVELAEHLRLGMEAGGGLVVAGDLEDPLVIARLAVHDKDADGGRARAQAPLVDEAAVAEFVAGFRVERIGFPFGAEQIRAHRLESLEEVADGRNPFCGTGVGGVEHELPQDRGDLWQFHRQVETAVAAQSVEQFASFRCRRLPAGEQVERKRTEPEHVHPGRIGGVHSLGSGEQPSLVAQAAGHEAQWSRGQAGHPSFRVGGQHTGGVPVGHLRLRAGLAVADHDRPWVEGAVHHAVPVRVVDDLGDLGERLELPLERHRAVVVREPQVQADVALGFREHQADAEFLVLDHVDGHLQAVVLEPRQQLVFVLHTARPGVLLRGRRPGLGQVEADTGGTFHVDVVEGGPILPALAVAERLIVDHPRADFALAARGEPDGGHQVADQQ